MHIVNAFLHFSQQNTMAKETEKQSSSRVQSGDSTTYVVPSSGNYMSLQPSGRSWEINREAGQNH